MTKCDPEIDGATQEFLKALASDTRQSLLQLFVGGDELRVGEIAERAGLSQSTTSAHLSLMRRGGLLASRKDGKEVLYRVDAGQINEKIDEIKSYLNRCCPPASS